MRWHDGWYGIEVCFVGEMVSPLGPLFVVSVPFRAPQRGEAIAIVMVPKTFLRP